MKVYQKLARWYCIYIRRSHYFMPCSWIDSEHKLRKAILCTRCKLNIDVLIDDE